MRTALYIGRFQPFHKGHLEYVKRILKENERLKIVLGSSREKATVRNPFSSKERGEMLFRCFKAEKLPIKKIIFYEARDYRGDNEKWLREIIKKVGKFDLVYAGENRLVYKIFKEAGFEVKRCSRIMGIMGKRIRELILTGEEWRHLVPPSVYSYLKEINGETRIRQISAGNHKF